MTRYIGRSATHQYTYGGKTYPGVTGILKVIDKSDALITWAARNTAEAAIELGSDGLSRLVETVGPIGAVKALSSRSSWKRDEAASLGTAVHEYADRFMKGDPLDDVTPTARARVENYVDWWNSSGWRLRASEAMVINPDFGYGGTLDLLARDRDGRTVLADIKTGKAVYAEAVLQLTAYGDAKFIETANGIWEMPKVDRYVILHVTATECRPIEVEVGAFERVAFAACCDLAQWRDSMKGKRL